MSKRFRTAAVALVLVMTASVALASSGSKTIEVFYNNIKLVVDGVPVTMTAEPFIYEGTTYLPVRAVAEALGQDVQWDGQTQTVYIGKRPEGNYLTDTDPYHATTSYTVNPSNRAEPLTIGGTKYAKGLRVFVDNYSTDTLSWNLNGQYSSLTGLVGLDDSANRWGPNVITFEGDGKELGSVTLQPGDLAKPVSLEVKGVLQLRVIIDNQRSTQSFVDRYGVNVDLVDMILK